MLDNDTQKNALEMGSRLASRPQPAAEASPVVAELRGRGLMLAIETVHPDSLEPNPGAAVQLMESTRAAGLLIGKGGLYGNVLRIAPPMTVNSSEVDEAADVLVESIAGLHQ